MGRMGIGMHKGFLDWKRKVFFDLKTDREKIVQNWYLNPNSIISQTQTNYLPQYL